MLFEFLVILVYTVAVFGVYLVTRRAVLDYGQNRVIPFELNCAIVLVALYLPLSILKFFGLVMSAIIFFLL